MKTQVIYKYPIDFGETIHTIPQGAKVLSVQEQHGQMYAWILHDKDGVLEERTFKVFGTGHDINDDNLKYMATCLEEGGNFVWHVFEQIKQ